MDKSMQSRRHAGGMASPRRPRLAAGAISGWSDRGVGL